MMKINQSKLQILGLAIVVAACGSPRDTILSDVQPVRGPDVGRFTIDSYDAFKTEQGWIEFDENKFFFYKEELLVNDIRVLSENSKQLDNNRDQEKAELAEIEPELLRRRQAYVDAVSDFKPFIEIYSDLEAIVTDNKSDIRKAKRLQKSVPKSYKDALKNFEKAEKNKLKYEGQIAEVDGGVSRSTFRRYDLVDLIEKEQDPTKKAELEAELKKLDETQKKRFKDREKIDKKLQKEIGKVEKEAGKIKDAEERLENLEDEIVGLIDVDFAFPYLNTVKTRLYGREAESIEDFKLKEGGDPLADRPDRLLLDLDSQIENIQATINKEKSKLAELDSPTRIASQQAKITFLEVKQKGLIDVKARLQDAMVEELKLASRFRSDFIGLQKNYCESQEFYKSEYTKLTKNEEGPLDIDDVTFEFVTPNPFRFKFDEQGKIQIELSSYSAFNRSKVNCSSLRETETLDAGSERCLAAAELYKQKRAEAELPEEIKDIQSKVNSFCDITNGTYDPVGGRISYDMSFNDSDQYTIERQKIIVDPDTGEVRIEESTEILNCGRTQLGKIRAEIQRTDTNARSRSDLKFAGELFRYVGDSTELARKGRVRIDVKAARQSTLSDSCEVVSKLD